MAAVKQQQGPLKDPEVRIGAYRLLPRADGAWIAIDESLPPGQRTVKEHKDRKVVEQWMKDNAKP